MNPCCLMADFCIEMGKREIKNWNVFKKILPRAEGGSVEVEDVDDVDVDVDVDVDEDDVLANGRELSGLSLT